MELTQENLQELFDYKDGFLFWKKKPAKSMKDGQQAGSLNKKWNRYSIKISNKLYKSARLIFLYHHGYMPAEVDHIDRDSANDKIENLRASDRSQNCQNRSSFKTSTSKYLGVSRHMGKYWVAQIQLNGKGKYIGSFQNEEDAALAYNREAELLFGEFANLNIITLTS